MKIIPVLILSVLALTACGSSGGTSTPPAPPPPVTPTPPPPPPEPTFEERLSNLAEFDPNPCRARTPGLRGIRRLAQERRAGDRRFAGVDSTMSASCPMRIAHGARVWATLVACAARSTEDHYNSSEAAHWESIRADGGDGITSVSSAPFWEDVPLPEPGIWAEYPYVRAGVLDRAQDGNRDGQRLLRLSQPLGTTTANARPGCRMQGFNWPCRNPPQHWLSSSAATLAKAMNASQRIAGCVAAVRSAVPLIPLCLFGPWAGENNTVGTSTSTPQVAAALDTAWAVWPDMDVLDLRNLAFDCAEDMPAPEGETATTRSYSYKNGRSFTSDTNSTWGHGILSMTCLFTPNGGLQNPVTGNAISGGIYGPVAGPITSASITGVDYTGRDFGYGFARPVARENHALAATANLSAVQPFSGHYASTYVPGTYQGNLWRSGAVSVDLTACCSPRRGRYPRRGRQRDRYRCAVASGQPDHSKWHGNATRRGRQPDRVESVPCAIDGIGSHHCGVRPYFEARLCRPSAGRSLAHPGYARPVALGERQAERVAVVRGAGQAHRPA